jgi:hypothetical protein
MSSELIIKPIYFSVAECAKISDALAKSSKRENLLTNKIGLLSSI